MLGEGDDGRKLPGGDESDGLDQVDHAQPSRHEQEVTTDQFDRGAGGELLAYFFHIQAGQSKDQGKDGKPQQRRVHQEKGIEGCAKQVEGVVV